MDDRGYSGLAGSLDFQSSTKKMALLPGYRHRHGIHYPMLVVPGPTKMLHRRGSGSHEALEITGIWAAEPESPPLHHHFLLSY
jgi:hypothetical protein